MSRNTYNRRPQPSTPTKVKLKTKARRDSDVSSSSLDLSDEDGYSGVDEISDDEDDDEEDVDAVEENAIRSLGSDRAPRPLSDDEEEEEDDEDDDDGDEDDNDNENDDDDDDDDLGFNLHDDNDNASWNGIASEVELSQASDFYIDANASTPTHQTERHVRFDIPFSDSDSTETEDDHADLFPDIFVSQTALDPAFRREIEHDDDDSSNSGSFWDYHGTYTETPGDDMEEAEEVVREIEDDEISNVASLAPPPVIAPAPEFDQPHELDGYESEFCHQNTNV